MSTDFRKRLAFAVTEPMFEQAPARLGADHLTRRRRACRTAGAIALALAAALAFPARDAAASPETVRVGGGAAPIENIFKRVKVPFEAATGIRLELIASGPDRALADLDAGRVDIASAGLSRQDWLDLMQQKKLPLKDPGAIRDRVIGRDEIRVITHPSVASVRSLSQAELRDIFTGRIYNWRQVGGPDIEVVVVYGSKIPGTNKLWQEQVLGGANWTLARREAGDTAGIKAMVAATPGAISIGPMTGGDRTLHSPASPSVGRPITAATIGEPAGPARRLFDFLAAEGQRYVAR